MSGARTLLSALTRFLRPKERPSRGARTLLSARMPLRRPKDMEKEFRSAPNSTAASAPSFAGGTGDGARTLLSARMPLRRPKDMEKEFRSAPNSTAASAPSFAGGTGDADKSVRAPIMHKVTELLIATYNTGKVRELSALLYDIPLKLTTLADLPGINEVEETGSTIRENAELKAVGYARQSGLWSLADDSGLEVAALGGAPGVYSSRFAGEGTSDETKMAKVLKELAAIQNADRDARFVCVMSIADNTGKIIFTAEGICTGKIANEPSGTNGFGYDPIFIPNGFDRTFGELSSGVKQQISHRARAVTEIIRYLQGFFKL